MSETITSPADFDRFAAIGAVTELEPASGRGAPVRPAVYAPAEGSRDKSFAAKIARSGGVAIPVAGPQGMFDEVRRDGDGNPVTGDAVLLSSEPAEAHRLTEALLEAGIAWGGLFVAPPPHDELAATVASIRRSIAEKANQPAPTDPGSLFAGPEADLVEQLVIDVLSSHETSSWHASHRHADAAVRYATYPVTGNQLWSGDNPVKRQIIAADALRDATWLMRNAVNSLLFGFWTSNSGTGIRAKLARSITASVVGYGSAMIVTGTTKGSALGDVNNQVLMRVNESGEVALLDEPLTGKQADQFRPSVYGFGTITSAPGASAVASEVILRRTGLSLSGLRRIRFADDAAGAKRTAAVRALAAAGMYATAAVAADGSFLRSDADLTPVSTAWNAHLRDGTKLPLDVNVADARQVLDAALADLDALGLGQADPIQLRFSPEQIAAMVLSAAKRPGNGSAGE